LWLTFRGVRAIDPLELAGIRTSGTTTVLQVTGPYRLVRHPLYLGWMLMAFGAAHMTGDRLTFAAISTLYVLIAIPFEERSLVRTFGTQYEDYRRNVRWRVVPYLY
jgi:protein-S-isoprenylcysteine O-methyltransferase Ste14